MKIYQKGISLFLLSFLCLTGFAQTLVKVGNKEISIQEFEKRYQENVGTVNEPVSKKEYLESLIDYELKLSEAYALRYDQSFVINNELNTYKEHLLQKYRYDRETFQFLVNEARERSKINISVSYIVTYNNEEKINQAYQALKQGKSFEEVAIQFSEDTSVIHNKGFVGYITCFTFPYKIENAIYGIRDGAFTEPFRNGNKWFIFKRNQTNTSKGKLQLQQLLFYYPGEVNEYYRDSLFNLAKSVKNKLGNNYSFDDAIKEYFSDYQTLQNRGILNSVGVGEYDPLFEEKVFQLQNIGEVTEPFETAFGVHIVKLLNKIPNDSISIESLEQKVEMNDRIAVAFTALYQKIEQKLSFKKVETSELLQTLNAIQENSFNDTAKVLATYHTQQIKAADWIQYFNIIKRNKTHFTEDELEFYFTQFSQQKLLSYYRNNLALFDDSFASQIKSFTENVMLFEIMQNKIWNNLDSSAIHQYYLQNQAAFKWKPYAKTWSFTSLTQENISSLVEKINSVEQLKNLSSNAVYFIHEGKEELENIKHKDVKAGDLYKSYEDGVHSILGIESVHSGGEFKTYEEALIDVTNAYQKSLEKKWIDELKKKYPVVINKKIYKKL